MTMAAMEHGYEEQGNQPGSKQELEQIEIELLLSGVHRLYGYDFRNYALPSLKRRIWHHVHAESLPTISALQEKVLHDRACFERFVYSLSIPVTEMFRDPGLFLTFRQRSFRSCGPILISGSGMPAARQAKRSTRWRLCCMRKACMIRQGFMQRT